jgi:hypothetical protein
VRPQRLPLFEGLLSERPLSARGSLAKERGLLFVGSEMSLQLPLVDVVALTEIEDHLPCPLSLGALGCRIVEDMVGHGVVREEDFKFLI